MIHYTLKQLRYFVAAAKVDSVTRAAENMNVSQPSISAAIAHLEDAFGLQLFVRHHAQGMSMTPDGRRFMVEAIRSLKNAEELGLFAAGLGGALKGNLDVACFSSVSSIVMPCLIRAFGMESSGISITSHEGYHETLVKGLRSGEYEQALTFELDICEDLEFLPLATLPTYVIMSEKNPLSSREIISLEELEEQPMVHLDLPLSRDYFNSLFSGLNLKPSVSQRVESVDMTRSMVANDFGYSLSNIVHLQSSSLNYEKRGGLRALDGQRYCAIPIVEDLRPLRLGLTHLKNGRLTRKAEAFAEFCKEYFAGAYLKYNQ
ncbi:MAG: LysR family transcriptional regulator [Amphritea sp.]